jgi:hypothetical protein
MLKFNWSVGQKPENDLIELAKACIPWSEPLPLLIFMYSDMEGIITFVVMDEGGYYVPK